MSETPLDASLAGGMPPAIVLQPSEDRIGRIVLLAVIASCCSLLIICLATVPQVALNILLFAVGFAITAVCLGEDSPYKTSVLAAYATGYFLRVLWILVAASTGTNFFALDDRTYDSKARLLQFNFWSLRHPTFFGQAYGSYHFGYPFLLSAVYQLFGHSILAAKLLNAVFGAGVVPLACWLTRRISDDRRTAILAAWLTAIYPLDIVLTMYILKDTILTFFFTLEIACVLGAVRQRSLLSLVAAVVAIPGVLFIRFYAIGEIVLGALVAVAAVVARQCFPDRTIGRWVLVLGVTVIAAIIAWLAILPRFQVYVSALITLERLAQERTGQGLAMPGIMGAVKGAVRYFLSPRPRIFEDVSWWEFANYPGSLMLYAMFPFAIVGVWNSIKQLDPPSVFVFIPFLAHAAIQIAVYQGGERQRLMTDVVFLVAVALGWRSRERHRMLIAAAYLSFVPAFMIQKALGRG